MYKSTSSPKQSLNCSKLVSKITEIYQSTLKELNANVESDIGIETEDEL